MPHSLRAVTNKIVENTSKQKFFAISFARTLSTS